MLYRSGLAIVTLAFVAAQAACKADAGASGANATPSPSASPQPSAPTSDPVPANGAAPANGSGSQSPDQQSPSPQGPGGTPSGPGPSPAGPTPPAGVGTLAIVGDLGAIDVDQAIAIPVSGQKLNADRSLPVTPIAGGQLALEISQSVPGMGLDDGSGSGSGEGLRSTVVMVLKGGDPLANFDSIKFVSAPTSGDEQLLNLATSVAKSDKIELGKIAPQGGDLVGDAPVGTKDFDLPEQRLQEMASLDDAMRVMKNQYANGGNPKGSIMGVQEFYFSAPITSALDQLSDPAKVKFDGWSPALHIDHSDFDFAKICAGTSAFRFEIPAPGAKRNVDDVESLTAITNTNPTMNPDGNSCGVANGADTAYIKHDPGQTNLYMNFQNFRSEIPPGTWTVKLDGVVEAKFDLNVSAPLVEDPKDPAKKVPRVYVPALQITTDPATHAVMRIDLWFFSYDKASGEFRKIEDYTTLKNTLEGFWFSLNGRQGGQDVDDPMSNEDSYGLPENGKAKSRTSFGKDWRLAASDDVNCPAPSDHARLQSVGVQYIMYGNRYSTNFDMKREAQTPEDCP